MSSTQTNHAQARAESDENTPDGASVVPDSHPDVRDDAHGRRTFLKGIGAAAVAGAAITHPSGPAQEAEAIPPLVLAGGAAGAAAGLGGGAVLGWALREFEFIGSNPPPEGLTPEVLKQQLWEAGRKTQSDNASTFIDNENILTGIEHVAYTDGKIAAIDALNEQQSEADVLDAARSALNSHIATVQENLLKSWNESAKELGSLVGRVVEHNELELGDVWWRSGLSLTTYGSSFVIENYDNREGTVELADGTNFTTVRIQFDGEERGSSAGHPRTTSYEWDPASIDAPGDGSARWTWDINDNRMGYLIYSDWNGIWQQIENVRADVSDGLALWVSSIYSDVQSGEIEINDLVTPRERAAMMAEEESMAQAMADLLALNIPIDTEREATVYLPNRDATVRGTLGVTVDQAIEAGETYDPDTLDGSVYLTYDASLGEGSWSAYETGVDGGTLTFNQEPFAGVYYVVHTAADETAEVRADDFTALDADGNEVDGWDEPDRWEADLSEQLETAITEVTEVDYYADTEEAQMETFQLRDQFTVDKIENTNTGEEEQSMTFENDEPQSDDNYITQEEWDEMEARNQELIEQYEDAQGGGISLDDWGMEEYGLAGLVVVLIAAAANIVS